MPPPRIPWGGGKNFLGGAFAPPKTLKRRPWVKTIYYAQRIRISHRKFLQRIHIGFSAYSTLDLKGVINGWCSQPQGRQSAAYTCWQTEDATAIRRLYSRGNLKWLHHLMLLRDFSSFDTMLLHLKLQTYFVLPGLISAIRSLQKFH